MYLHFEQNISSRTECTIHSLSWMGKVPDSMSGDTQGGWKLNRSQYYSEGWLASGNAKGIVGVTFTASHCRKYEPPNRSNFNLRGHRSEVVLVRWNEPYQKLATCDSQGIIFVWIKHEGRWSIELINDRNSQVTDFAWSHDGRMALICYCDGFVLVGSVAGQRYWSSMLNLDNTSITCGVWSPDDQKVMFGTTDGQIIVMTSQGAMVTQITILDGMEITSLLWSCEKFNMEETEDNKDCGVKVTDDTGDSSPTTDKPYTLAVCFKYGAIYFMSNYDDVCPKVVHSMLIGLKMDWSNCGQYLAVGGFTRLPNLLCQNEIHFYTASGELAHWESVPSQGKPLTALCWGHNDRRLFVAAGHNLHVAWIVKHVPTLQYLCQRSVQCLVRSSSNLEKLPIPVKLCSNVQALFTPTVKSYIPDPFKLRAFVSTPPPGSERLFCTMIHHGEETSGGHYTLYLEYLGGLIPLLKGKRASKLRPDFIIFDPRIKATRSVRKEGDEQVVQFEAEIVSDSTSSDSDFETDRCGGSPRGPKKKKLKHFRAEKVDRSTTFRTLNELFYNDNLPESSKLVEVMSNIWGTKFRIVGTAPHLPEDLGNVLYKTSLLHLQPRQMTVTVTELPRDDSLLAQDKNFTPAGVGEEDPDRLSILDGLLSGVHNEYYMKKNIPSQLDELSNQDSEIISVDVLTNHMDFPGHMDGSHDNGSLVNCYSDRQKSVCMKTKLSPASETHPQNNHAFKTGEEPLIINTGSYGGARPKVPRRSSYTANQSVTEDSGVLTVNSSHVSSSKLYSAVNTDARSLTSRQENSAEHEVSRPSLCDITGAIVGDYFFACVDSKEPLIDQTSPLSDTAESANRQNLSFVDRYVRTDSVDSEARWADPAYQGIRFVDDDEQSVKDLAFEGNIIFDSSQVLTPTSESQKRLYLKGCPEPDTQVPDKTDESCEDKLISEDHKTSVKRSSKDESVSDTKEYSGFEDTLIKVCESLRDSEQIPNGLEKEYEMLKKKRKSSLLSDFERLDITQTASLPSSPLHRLHKPDSPTRKIKEDIINGKCKHQSPLFKKRSKYPHSSESSDDEYSSLPTDFRYSSHFKNLESFQKAQLKNKLRRTRSKGDERRGYYRQFVLHNKAPLWNENSQVYQLDFGGRVTQESAKNFQVEHRGKQVMQFGRIDSNAYTLDFQYPFTAIQAFAVALANVTQRLK